MDYPDITVAIISYKRPEILRETLGQFFDLLRYEGEIRYLVSHDGDASETRKLLHDKLGWHNVVKIIGEGERRGLGANNNQALRGCDTDIVLHTQDDYHLLKPLDLTEHVEKLLVDETAGWIRLKLTAGQDFTATVKDRYWRVSWHSQGHYIASDQPHLKHWPRFHGYYGMYLEGVTVVETENEWVGRSKGLGQLHPDWPEVLIPTSSQSDSSWLHVGDEISWKDRGL